MKLIRSLYTSKDGYRCGNNHESLIEDDEDIQIGEQPEYLERSYEIIKRMDFNSDRKRMSIVVRD